MKALLDFARNIIPERSGVRLFYHKFSAILAALTYGFPAKKLHVIGVTGTSGKSTTTELIFHILQQSGRLTGSLSTIQFHFGDTTVANETLRTSLRPWAIQKHLRRMIRMGAKYAVLEVSSHALDQNRFWGVDFDTAVMTNVFDNEHLDYHETFADYLRTKLKLFEKLNQSYRKSNIPKSAIINGDDENRELFEEVNTDKKWLYGLRSQADIRPENIQYRQNGMTFTLNLANHPLEITASMIGEYNLQNILAAVATATSSGVDPKDIKTALESFTGSPGRLEIMPRQATDQPIVIIDFSYKPSALAAVFATLKTIAKKRIILVWGGAGGRSVANWQASAEIIHNNADEIILTTDDPGNTDPQYIVEKIRAKIPRAENENFFFIPDRYEAMRYAIYSGDPEDIVLIAGRGQEGTQVIGKRRINFDDREVAKEIMSQ